MDTYRAIGLCEGFVDAEDESEILEAWQYLHDTGIAYQLQGWFGRACQDLIIMGVINE